MTGLVEDLPWRSMSPQALEELTFAILVEMGATHVTWRSSEGSINTPDGGRDIEAVFIRPTPDDDIDRQVWWIECKRREGSVSPTDIKEAAVNSTAYPGVDAFIVVTNSHFTNPTRDWVDKHNERKRGPVVKLWDGRRLQSLVDKHPSAAAKTLHTLLAFEQRIEFLSNYFFERTRILTELELRDAWERRDEIANIPFLVAASYSDICTGNIHERPWMSLLSGDASLLGALHICLRNLVAKMVNGHPLVNETLVDTIGYVLVTAAATLPVKALASFLDDPWRFNEPSGATPEAILEYVVQPVKQSAARGLQLHCANDCARHHIDRDPAPDSVFFWEKYLRPPAKSDKEWLLCITNLKVPCAVGMEVTDQIACPLSSNEYFDDNRKYVDMLKRVILFRLEHPDGQYLRYSSIDRERAIQVVSKAIDDQK